MGATEGTPAVMTRTLSSPSRRDLMYAREASTSYFAVFWYQVFSYNAGTASNAACSLSSSLNNNAVSTVSIQTGVPTLSYVQMAGTVSLDAFPSSFGISLSCANGASATVFLDDIDLVMVEDATSTPTSTAESSTSTTEAATSTSTVETATSTDTSTSSSSTPAPTATGSPSTTGAGVFSLTNGDFESGMEPWIANQAVLTTTDKYRGVNSLSMRYDSTAATTPSLKQIVAFQPAATESVPRKRKRDVSDSYIVSFYSILVSIGGTDSSTTALRHCTLQVNILDEGGNVITTALTQDVTDNFFVEAFGKLTTSVFSLSDSGVASLAFAYSCNEYVTDSMFNIDNVVLQAVDAGSGDATVTATPTPTPSPTETGPATPTVSLDGERFHIRGNGQYLTTSSDAFRLTSDASSATEFVLVDGNIYIISQAGYGSVLMQTRNGDFMRYRSLDSTELTDARRLKCQSGRGSKVLCRANADTDDSVYSLYQTGGDDTRAGLIIMGSYTFGGGDAIILRYDYLNTTDDDNPTDTDPTDTTDPTYPTDSPTDTDPTSSLVGDRFYITTPDGQYVTTDDSDGMRLTSDINSASHFVFQNDNVYITSSGNNKQGYLLIQFGTNDFIRDRATNDAEINGGNYLRCSLGSAREFTCQANNDSGTNLFSLYTSDASDSRAGMIVMGTSTWAGGAAVPMTVRYLDDSLNTTPVQKFYVRSNGKYMQFLYDIFRLTDDVNSASQFTVDGTTVSVDTPTRYKGAVLFQFSTGDFLRARTTDDTEMKPEMYTVCSVSDGADFNCHLTGDDTAQLYSLYTGGMRAGNIVLGAETWADGEAIPMTVQYI